MNTKIKALVMDVDGTLTDGKIYISAEGEAFKAFNVKDGYGVVSLRKHGIIPIIITGRQSKIVEVRASELGIDEVHQGIHDKLSQLKQCIDHYDIKFDEVAYIGDDQNDLEVMKVCGFTGCPADAIQAVKEQVDYICEAKGGQGAVREFINEIVNVIGF